MFVESTCISKIVEHNRKLMVKVNDMIALSGSCIPDQATMTTARQQLQARSSAKDMYMLCSLCTTHCTLMAAARGQLLPMLINDTSVSHMKVFSQVFLAV